MARIGCIGVFYHSDEDFDAYMSVNSIKADIRVDSLIAFAGPKVLTLDKSLLSPLHLKAVFYDYLTKVLKNHYKPRVTVFKDRSLFYSRSQMSVEYISYSVAKCISSCLQFRFAIKGYVA